MEVAERIRRYRGVQRVFSTTGRADVVVLAEVNRVEELGELALKINTTSGVVASETLLGFEVT
jgi:uncharacterized protein with GYD domain